MIFFRHRLSSPAPGTIQKWSLLSVHNTELIIYQQFAFTRVGKYDNPCKGKSLINSKLSTRAVPEKQHQMTAKGSAQERDIILFSRRFSRYRQISQALRYRVPTHNVRWYRFHQYRLLSECLWPDI